MLSIEGEKIKEVTTMAIGLKSRIIYRVKEKETNEENYWAGEYKLLMKQSLFQVLLALLIW